MPTLLQRADALLPTQTPRGDVARALAQARCRARARGLPVTARVVLKMLADMRDTTGDATGPSGA